MGRINKKLIEVTIEVPTTLWETFLHYSDNHSLDINESIAKSFRLFLIADLKNIAENKIDEVTDAFIHKFNHEEEITRIEKCKQLIETTSLSIKEISTRCGYKHGNSLSSIFKIKYGISIKTHRLKIKRMNKSRKGTYD